MEPKVNDMAGDELVEAATELTNFAWSVVVTDCRESSDYLNGLVDNVRSALARLSRSTSTDAVTDRVAFARDVWDDATNSVCQTMQERGMCNCPDGGCVAATVSPETADVASWSLACPSLQGGAEPASHIKFRRQALEIAGNLDGADFAGLLEAVDENTAEGLARTVAIAVAAYDWTVADDGTLFGLVAGDQGWASTGIKIAPANSIGETGGTETGEYWKAADEAGMEYIEVMRASLAAEKLKVAELERERDDFKRMFQATVKNGASETMIDGMDRIIAAEQRVAALVGALKTARSVIVDQQRHETDAWGIPGPEWGEALYDIDAALATEA